MNNVRTNLESKCYIDLCNSYLNSTFIYNYLNTSVDVDSIVVRVILENSFDINICKYMFYKKVNFIDSIIFDTMDKPLFFYIGLKSLPFKKKVIREMSKIKVKDYDELDDESFIKLCQYVIAKPYEVYVKLNVKMPVDIQTNKYLLTLIVLNYCVNAYRLKLVHVKYCSLYKTPYDKRLKYDKNIEFDALSPCLANSFVHDICIKGLEFCKSVFKKYNLHRCGDLLFHMITTDNALYFYNITNLNSNRKVSMKNGLANYEIVRDKHNVALPFVKPTTAGYWVHDWNCEFIMILREFNTNAKLTAIIPFNEYFTLEITDNTVPIPSLRSSVSVLVDRDVINQSLINYRKSLLCSGVPSSYFKYITILVDFGGGTIESIIYSTEIRKCLKLHALEPMVVTYLNKLYVMYEASSELLFIEEDDIIVFENSNAQLTIDMLLAYAFINVLGWDHKYFKPYRAGYTVFTEGVYFKDKPYSGSIISKINSLFYKKLLEEKYLTLLSQYFNQWIDNLTANTVLPPTLIFMLIDRVKALYSINKWIE